jgi:hypothetical protein
MSCTANPAISSGLLLPGYRQGIRLPAAAARVFCHGLFHRGLAEDGGSITIPSKSFRAGPNSLRRRKTSLNAQHSSLLTPILAAAGAASQKKLTLLAALNACFPVVTSCHNAGSV